MSSFQTVQQHPLFCKGLMGIRGWVLHRSVYFSSVRALAKGWIVSHRSQYTLSCVASAYPRFFLAPALAYAAVPRLASVEAPAGPTCFMPCTG